MIIITFHRRGKTKRMTDDDEWSFDERVILQMMISSSFQCPNPSSFFSKHNPSLESSHSTLEG